MRKLTQKQKILNHLLDGNELTELDSIRLGMGTSMRSRISELRADGYPIEDKFITHYKAYFITADNIARLRECA